MNAMLDPEVIEFWPWDLIPADRKRGDRADREVLGRSFKGEPVWLPWMGGVESTCPGCGGATDPQWYCSEGYCPTCCTETDEGE